MAKFGNYLYFVLISFLIMACSNIRFTSDTLIPVVFESKKDHTRDISIEVTNDFYLWGLVPGAHEIKIDRTFAERGFDSVADFVIEDSSDKKDLAWTLLSFGFYMPKSYVLKGKTYLR